jgi:prevent-host-death family protein
MPVVNMLDAKSRLSRLVQAVESGEEEEIVIARNGKPAARLVPIAPKPDVSKRIGIAKGEFVVPDDFDADNEEIAKLFYGEDEA